MSNPNTKALKRRFEVNLEYFKKLRFIDRLRILIGYNVVARVTLRGDRRTGEFHERGELFLTDSLGPQHPKKVAWWRRMFRKGAVAPKVH